MKDEAMSAALDQIHDEAMKLLDLDLPDEAKAILDRFIALARYKFPVTSQEPDSLN